MKKSFEIGFDWTDFFTIKENIITQKEHSEIEYKSSFHHPRSKDKSLLKWIASFSNSKGGLIVFGVENNGNIVGLKNEKLSNFDNKDLTQELLNFFSPEIEFELFIKEVENNELGFLYIYESKEKPVIAIKTGDKNVKESDIYYRYPGESRKIKYGELITILNSKKQKLNDKWLNLMQNIAQIGVDNVGVLDTIQGKIIGHKNSLLISKELLKQVKIINEGTFVETGGIPTLKLIGNLQPVDKSKVIRITEKEFQIITHYELFNSFFNDDLKENDAKNFFRKVLHESSVYYPIYYYLIKSKLSEKELKELLSNEKGINDDKILERFKIEKNNYNRFKNGKLDTGTDAAKDILRVYELLKNEKDIPLQSLSSIEMRHTLQAITHLKDDDFKLEYIRKVLKSIYDNYFSKKDITKTMIRKSICHIDLVTYGKKYFDNIKKSP